MSFPIHPHLLFELLAYVVGFRIFLILRSQQGDSLSEHQRVSILIGAAIGALLGSKILGLLDTEQFWSSPTPDWKLVLGSKTILGGLLGGTIGVEIAKRILHITTRTGDLLVMPLIIGIAIGRIGCFLSGIHDGTHGVPTKLPWGLDLGDGIPRHPTSLYEIGFLLLLGLYLYRQRSALKRLPGATFATFLLAYCLFRSLVDALKPTHKLLWGLSPIQIFAILGAMYFAQSLIRITLSMRRLS